LDPGIQGVLSYTDRLPEINIPSLILWGKHDMVVPTVIAQETYDNLGSSVKRLVIFEKSGHAPFGSEPNLFADKVILFIDQNK
jgi:pimeloyl-ACP methyl ester carboxylesterase